MSRNFLQKLRGFEGERLPLAPQSTTKQEAASVAAAVPRRMSLSAIVGIGTLAIAVTLPMVSRAQKSGVPNVTADLPAGPMQAKATTACLECHEARIILQQRLSKAAWTKEVDKMTKWGAVVDPADRDALIDYLSSNFSPDKPAFAAQHTSVGRSGR
jgi:hypothetical protein